MPLLPVAGIFLGILARVCRTDAGGYAVKSEVHSSPGIDGIQYAAFHLFQGFDFGLVGGKDLRLRRDLIRLTEESVRRLNCERSIADIALNHPIFT